MTRHRKILIIRPDHLGDVILSLPVAQVLKRTFPNSIIIYFSSRNTAALHGLVDYVDGWIADEDQAGSKPSSFSLASLFQKGGFDILIELKPSWRTAIGGFLSRIQTRIGTSRRLYSIFYNKRVNVHRKSSGRHQIDLELAMLKPLGIEVQGLAPAVKINETCRSKARGLLNLEPKSYIVIHPSSSGSAPNWPIVYYGRLAAMIKNDTNFEVVITGLEDEAGPNFKDCVNLSGKTDLEALAGVIADSALFVSGSTGPLHLADALGIKSVSFIVNNPVMGPERWGPRRNMGNVIKPDSVCACAKLSDCHCLEQVTPVRALNKIREVLKESECGTARK